MILMWIGLAAQLCGVAVYVRIGILSAKREAARGEIHRRELQKINDMRTDALVALLHAKIGLVAHFVGVKFPDTDVTVTEGTSNQPSEVVH